MVNAKRVRWVLCFILWAILLLTACGGAVRNTAEGDNALKLGPPIATPLIHANIAETEHNDLDLQDTFIEELVTPAPTAQETEEPTFLPVETTENAQTSGNSSAVYTDNADSQAQTTPGIQPMETPSIPLNGSTENAANAALKSNYKASEIAVYAGNDNEFSIYQLESASAALEAMNIPTEGRELMLAVTFQSDTFMSCLVDIMPQDSSEHSSFTPLTLDIRNGERVQLGDLFINGSGWQGVLSDIVMRIAQDADMTLLCDVPPVREDHPFFIWQGYIALVYMPFEITTYEEESPCFLISLQEIEPYLLEAHLLGG